jgi:hypothetical protein
MTDEEVITAVVNWLTLRSGIMFIVADQSGDQPAFPYGVARLNSTDQVREQPQDFEYEDVGDDVMTRPRLELQWFFSLHVYGDGCFDVLRRVRAAYHVSQICEPVEPALTIYDISQIRNLTEYIGEKVEPRAQMDLIVRGVANDGFLIDVIEEATITVERK